METRTLLLALHVAAAASWLGADIVLHLIGPRLRRDPATVVAWTRVEVWLHDRYYAAVVAVILATGVLLVLDGDWSWGTDFIWVGVGAIVGGAALGGGGLGGLAKRRLAALESGDQAAADATERPFRLVGLVVTALPLVAVLAMVDKWGL